MRRFISRLTVLLFLPMALVPSGFMPAALADGNGFLMLCPSERVVFSNLNQRPTTPLDSLINAGLERLSDQTQHDHHKVQVAPGDGDYNVESHESHNAVNVKCSYATVSTGYEVLPLSPLESFTGPDTQQFLNAGQALVVVFPRVQKQHSRAPPALLLSS